MGIDLFCTSDAGKIYIRQNFGKKQADWSHLYLDFNSGDLDDFLYLRFVPVVDIPAAAGRSPSGAGTGKNGTAHGIYQRLWKTVSGLCLFFHKAAGADISPYPGRTGCGGPGAGGILV